MCYRIVESDSRADLPEGKEIAAYESAYRALEYMKNLARRHGKVPNWYLLDASGLVLAGPDDLWEAVAS
jgi:hypothetical protein